MAVQLNNFQRESTKLNQLADSLGAPTASNTGFTGLASQRQPQAINPIASADIGNYNFAKPDYDMNSVDNSIDYSNGDIGQDYYDNLLKVESNGDYNAYNESSGASGGFQFVGSTGREYAKKLGLSPTQARTINGQNAMVRAFTNDNRNYLVKNGFKPTQRNLYMSHQFGRGGAVNILSGGSGNQSHLAANGVGSVNEWYKKFGPRFN